MHSDHSATYSGKVNGAERVSTPHADSSIPESASLPRGHRHLGKKTSSPILSREEPFGLTVIIGGTNVRFCISYPGNSKPITKSVKWQQLSDTLAPQLQALKVEFGDAHKIVYATLAKTFVKFIQSHFNPDLGPVPIENLCALNFSVAGRVFGDTRKLPQFKRPVNGIDAVVSTTNTGLKFSNEPVGRVFFNALKAEFPQIRFPEERVLVLNDARAGLEGEKLLQKLPPTSRVFFEICGTGDGSDYDEEGFDEIGHRTMFSSQDHTIVVHVGDEIKEYLQEDGSFKNLENKSHLRYAENMVAGPWTAIRFVKSLEEKHEVMNALAHKIIEIIKKEDEERKKKQGKQHELGDSPPVPLTPEEVLLALYNLADLKFTERTRWAVYSNSRLIKAISHLIFTPNHRDIRRAMPCNFNVESLETSNPEKALVLLAWARQKLHFKERGMVAGAVYRKMVERGVAPDHYILGGGLGEAFNDYSAEDRQDALDLINEHGKLPPGVFDFSRVSPEARESAISYQTVEDTKREWDEAKMESVPLPKFAN